MQIDEPAKVAVELQDEILAQLDAMTGSAAQSAQSSEPQEPPAPIIEDVPAAEQPVVFSREELLAQQELIAEQRARIEKLKSLLAEIEKKEQLDAIKKSHGIPVQ